jgi:hypothetical protein
VKINPAAGVQGGKRKEKERRSAAKCADRTVCFHLIYQETQLCGRIPRERVNHVYLIVFVVDVVLFVICYTVIA